MPYAIAIDGPAGAGKSTVAKLLAGRLGAVYIDTGAMFRAMALFLTENGIDPEDEAAVAKSCANAQITIRLENGAQRILLSGEDVTDCLRTEGVGNAASRISKVGAVRNKLLELQRELAGLHNVVMDGRDIGTVVLPDAELKVYLDADPHIRALRRARELEEKGEVASIEQIEEDIRRRDRQDMEREIAPLRRAEDALLLESSSLAIDEVLESLLSMCRERGLWK